MTSDISGLPYGWATVRVDRVGAVRLGRQRSPDKHTGAYTTKYLRAANITVDGIDLDDVLEMDFTPAERDVFSLRAGDILLTEASGSPKQVGRAAQWRDGPPGYCYQNTLIRFRPHVVLSDYAIVVFRYYASSGVFARTARGVGIQHLGAGRFSALSFPLPPVDEQQRIANSVFQRLGDLGEAETRLRNALDLLELQRKEIVAAAVSGTLLPMSGDEGLPTSSPSTPNGSRPDQNREEVFPFGQLPTAMSLDDGFTELPPSWVWARTDQVGEVRLGRQRSPEHQRGDHVRPYLRVANVLEDRIDISSIHEMNFTPAEYEVFQLKYGDILLNEGQSAELVGRPAMFRDELPGACFQNHLIRFRSKPEVEPEFALLVFLHYLHSGRFQALSRGSTNIANLGLERFRSMPFPLPSLPEQRAIVNEARRRMKNASDQANATRSSLDRVPDMVTELLAAAVAGELVPQTPSDEPAELLLERLGIPPKDAPLSAKTRRGKGRSMRTSRTSTAASEASSASLIDIVRSAEGPVALPDLFALAGYDPNHPEDVERFYLALRSVLGKSLRSVGHETENALLEVIVDAS